MKVFPASYEEMLAWMVKVLFYGLKTIGLAPFSIQFRTLNRNSRNTCIKLFLFSGMGLLYNLVLAVLIQIVGVVGISNSVSLDYPNESSLSQVLDLMFHIFPISTSSFIVVYLAFRQSKAAIIMNRLLDVHFLLPGDKDQLFNKKTYILLSLQMAYHVFLWASYLSTELFINPSLSSVWSHSIHVIAYFVLIEYSIILGVVAREIEVLNKNLSNLNDFPSYSFRISLPHDRLAALSSPSRSQLTTLKLLHSIRTTLFELSQDIGDLFSLPILLSVACIFVLLVKIFYVLVIMISFPGDFPMMFSMNNATWLLKSVSPLILLALNVTNIAKKTSLTGRIVHTLLANAKNQKIITELEQFSLHLLHEDASFTAHGFFTLDFTLLQSIIGATVTYLVIVLQSAQSANDHH